MFESSSKNNDTTFAMEKEDEAGLESCCNREGKLMFFERYQFDCINDNKGEYADLFDDNPYLFYLFLNPLFVDEQKLKVIERIIENEKPAHTLARIILLQPWFCVGMHTFLGMNTQLNELAFTVDKSTIGRDSIENIPGKQNRTDGSIYPGSSASIRLGMS